MEKKTFIKITIHLLIGEDATKLTDYHIIEITCFKEFHWYNFLNSCLDCVNEKQSVLQFSEKTGWLLERPDVALYSERSNNLIGFEVG